MNKLIYIEPNSERWLNLEDLPNEIWKDIQDYEGLYQISNYGTGVTRSKEKKYKKVEQYTLDNVFIKQYKSIQDASIMTSIKHNKSGVRAISKCARGIIKSYRGFKWKFVSNDSEMMHNG